MFRTFKGGKNYAILNHQFFDEGEKMDVGTALGLLSQTLGIVKAVRDIDKGFDAAEVKAQLAEVYGNLADVKMALTDAEVRIRDKEQEIARLKDAMKRREKVVEKSGFPYPVKENGEADGNPFCPVCMEVDQLFIRVATRPRGLRGECECPKCHAVYVT